MKRGGPLKRNTPLRTHTTVRLGFPSQQGFKLGETGSASRELVVAYGDLLLGHARDGGSHVIEYRRIAVVVDAALIAAGQSVAAAFNRDFLFVNEGRDYTHTY